MKSPPGEVRPLPGRRQQEGRALRRLPAKVLKEIIASIKIFTPAKGLKTFP